MLTLERLKEVLIYDAETGEFRWAKTRGGAHKGKLAGEIHRSEKSRTSYVRIELDGIRYFGHNLAWFWVYGEFPAKRLDHKDRSGLNNQIDNLREASDSQNKFNSGLYKNNTSGHPGITKAADKWKVEIGYQGKRLYFGVYSDLAEAIAVRKEQADKLFGEFV